MNTEELQNEWNLIYEHILSYDSIDRSQTSAFLSRLQPRAMSDGFIMLTVDDEFMKSWIERHYADVIKQAFRDVKENEFMIAIEVDPNQEPATSAPSTSGTAANTTSGAAKNDIPSETAPSEPSSSPDQNPDTPSTIAAPISSNATESAASIVEPDRPTLESAEAQKASVPESMIAPTSSLTFENFVIGASNQMAYSMAVAVAEEPGRQMLNPLFIYGKSGLGKTHLMRAIQNYVAETRPTMRTVYVDSADFLSGYVEATVAHDKEKTSYNNFKNNYQEADILLIDDIQYLQGKEQTLDIVFQIFNHMVDQGKQVVLSADRAPKSITMDERYQSRFNSGGTFDIQPPEIETKLGIIKSFVDEYSSTSNRTNFTLPGEIRRFIAENSSSNIRELKSAVTKVIYAMNAFGRNDISVEEVSRLLENHFSGGTTKRLTIGDIQKQVELYYDVTHSDLIGQKRSRKIVYARQIAIYLSREMLDLPYNYIAKSFGGRDHTTIMYSVTNVEKKMKVNRELNEELENIKRKIKDM